MDESVQFTLGVDLGTTHSAIAYVELDLSEGEEVAEHVLAVPQLTAPGTIESKGLLPSFLYLPHADELAAGELALPWRAESDFVAGELARILGSKTPLRLVSSAKSWLCHPGVDRRAAILPPDAPAEVARLSPQDASIRYLEHLRDAWNLKHPEAPFEEQDIVLTVPASFDPAARELTAEAAKRAGYARLTLLEEPQAALYSWIQRSEGTWRDDVSVGDVLLVVDVGGGTTDFSLMTVEAEDGSLTLRRVAVGDHILLGGDNMDLALAHIVRQKLETDGKTLDAWQLGTLVHGCRAAKERLLTEEGDEAAPIVVPSRGSKLVSGSLRTELTRTEVSEYLLNGFFPVVEAAARPGARARAALTQLGLPYAQDAAITRHLAAFLAKQAGAIEAGATEAGATEAGATEAGATEAGATENGAPEASAPAFARPTAVLFNGGVFKSPILVERILSVLNGWLASAGAPPARILEGADLDLACARGAAYYGYARRGGGVRIRGGTAKSFYVGVETAMPAVPGLEPPITALCVAPFGLEEGAHAGSPSQEFGLVVGEPVRFRFFSSSVRRDDVVGSVVERWSEGELEELDAIEATVPPRDGAAGEVVPVRLRAGITEVGTLELEAVPRGDGDTFKVALDVRGAS